jgi:hypothetical protein
MQLTRKPRGWWTLERCHAEALKYETRGAFKHGSGDAYQAAWRNGWLDLIQGHMVEGCKPPGYWTFERCRAEALKYETRGAFQRGSKTAYAAAKKGGWLDQIRGHMVEVRKPKGWWTLERCQAEALKYETRTAFQLGSRDAHAAAQKKDWLDQICTHMIDGSPSDGDCFYFWRVVGAYFNGLPVYKPGVTSVRLKFDRIDQVARAGGLEYDLVLWLPVVDAYALERKVKAMGVSPHYTGFNGASEFRAFTDDEVKQIKAMALAEFVL